MALVGSTLGRGASVLGSTISPPRRRRRSGPSLTEEQEQGLLAQLGDVGLSGLSAVGNLLDLPGSVVRDVIAGEDPLDQLLPWNWFSREGRTTGAELAGNKRTPEFGSEEFWGGLGLEILADPLTYLTLGGALTKAGKVFQKAGLLDEAVDVARRAIGPGGKQIGKRVAKMTVTPKGLLEDAAKRGGDVAAETIGSLSAAAKGSGFKDLGSFMARYGNKPLGGPAGFRLPFSPTVGVFGSGKVGQKMAGAMDVLGEGIKYSAPIRTIRGLLDPRVSVLGTPQWTKAGQKLAERVNRGAPKVLVGAQEAALDAKEAVRTARTSFEEVYGPETSHALQARFGDDVVDLDVEIEKVFDDILRFTAEAEPKFGRAGALQRAGELVPGAPASLRTATNLAGLDNAIAKLTTYKDALHKSLQDYGIKTSDLETLGHLPRYANRKALSADEELLMDLVPTRGVSTAGRREAIRDVPAAVIHKMLIDARARGNTERMAEYILENFAEYLNPRYKATSQGRQIGKLAEFIEGKRRAGKPIRQWQLEKHIPDATKAENAIAQHAYDLARWVNQHGKAPIFTRGTIEDTTKYMKNASLLKRNAEAIHEHFAENLRSVTREAPRGDDMTLRAAFQNMNMDADKALETFAKRMGSTPDEVAGLTIPREVWEAGKNSLKPFEKPTEWGGAIGRIFDAVNNAMRGALTLPFPAFHARNLLSGQYVNLTSGHVGLANVPAYLGAIRETKRFTKAVKAAEKGKPLSKADQQLMREFNTYLPLTGGRGIQPGQRYVEDFVGGGLGGEVSMAGARAPGELMQKVPGLKTAGTGYAGLMRLGGKGMQAVEWYNRAPMYLYLRRKGFSPLKAADEVEKLQFDYSKLTSAERGFFKRGALFYCVPDHAEALTRDGWKTHDQIDVGDELLTYNLQSRDLEWQPCREVASFEHDQDLIVWKNDDTTLQFTPEHRWPVMLGDTKNVTIVTGDALQNSTHLTFMFLEETWSEGELNLKRFEIPVEKGEVLPEHYKGIVWCPRTENGTWVMRQGRTVVITGNTFSRRIAPLVVKNLMERPGGAMGQSIRAASAAKAAPGQPVPEWIGETTAIPVGKLEDGTLRFITGLGLPQEDVAPFLTNASAEALSRMTPLLKAPVELAFGRSLFQRGRPLDELDPSMGRIGTNIRQLVTGKKERGRAPPLLGQNWLEFAFANSPLSRFISTARTITDPRKYQGPVPAVIPQLLTGVRTTDVSPASQDAEIREMAAEAMKRLGGRTFEKPYIPAETLAELSPQQQAEAMRLNALLTILAERAKRRKAERQATAVSP